MLRRTLTIGFVLVGLLHGEAATTPPPAPVETMYAGAVAEETAVRKALADTQAPLTVLKAVRTVVADYEAIVRFYPASSYCDDALWRAGLTSIDAFKKFGDPHDRDASVRLLRLLAVQYPSSRLAKHVPEVLSAIGPASSPATQTQPPSSMLPAAPPSQAPSGTPSTALLTTPSPATTAPGVKLSTIKEIRRDVLPDAVRVTIELDTEVPFHEERIEGPSRVFFDLSSTRTVPALADKTLRFDGDTEPVHQIRIGRHADNVTRVVLDLAGVSNYSVYPLYQPYRLVIDCVRGTASTPAPAPALTIAKAAPSKPLAVRPAAPMAPLLKERVLLPDLVFSLPSATPIAGAALQRARDADGAADAESAAAAVPPAVMTPPVVVAPPPTRTLDSGFSMARQLGLSVSRIVIDPGHGGHDPGAIGKGVTEAELVLDVSLRLEKLLRKVPGIEVTLTRSTDEFVTLQERTAIANRAGADLFLSIHANASSNQQTHGVETYYLDFASTLSAAAVVARENAASGQAMAGLPDIVKSIALNNKLDESRDFATEVQRSMIERLRGTNKTVKDLGVKQAPFMVLIGAAMPSVLAEISFVTNAADAKLLNESAYRQRIAEALFNAVRKYQTSLKSVATVARQP